MTEFEILTAVQNSGGSIPYVELLNIGLNDPTPDSLADRKLIEKLISNQILRGEVRAFSSISFGPNGHLRLKELQDQLKQQRNQAAKDAKEKRSQKRWELFFAALGAFLAYIFPIIVPWSIDFLSRLFNWIAGLFA